MQQNTHPGQPSWQVELSIRSTGGCTGARTAWPGDHTACRMAEGGLAWWM